MTCTAIDQYIRDPADCQIYYHCDAGLNPVQQSCGNGLYFDTNTTRCEYVAEVSCTPSPAPATAMTTTEETMTTTTETSTTTTNAPATTTDAPETTTEAPTTCILYTVGGCLLSDSSGYWTNATDMDMTTCVTIPRDDHLEPFLKMRLYLTGMTAVQSLIFDQENPLITISLTHNMTTCDQEMFLFTKKITECSNESVKPCIAKSRDVNNDHTCQYTCQCEPVDGSCYMYIGQRMYPPHFSSNVRLCNLKISGIN